MTPREKKMIIKILERIFDNLLSWVIYSTILYLLLCFTYPAMSQRELTGIALILGFFAGLINSIAHVIVEQFKGR